MATSRADMETTNERVGLILDLVRSYKSCTPCFDTIVPGALIERLSNPADLCKDAVGISRRGAGQCSRHTIPLPQCVT